MEAGNNWKFSLWPSELGLETHPPGRQVTCPGSSGHWVLAVFALGSASDPRVVTGAQATLEPCRLPVSRCGFLTFLCHSTLVGPYCRSGGIDLGIVLFLMLVYGTGVVMPPFRTTSIALCGWRAWST